MLETGEILLKNGKIDKRCSAYKWDIVDENCNLIPVEKIEKIENIDELCESIEKLDVDDKDEITSTSSMEETMMNVIRPSARDLIENEIIQSVCYRLGESYGSRQ